MFEVGVTVTCLVLRVCVGGRVALMIGILLVTGGGF